MRDAPSDHEDRIRALENAGGGGGVTDHGALTGLTDDDHTQYLKEKASGGTAAEVPTHTHASSSEAGTVAHSDLTGLTTGDPHTQYQKESEKGAASGYASLDGSTKVPIAELPTGTGGTNVALGNHTHAALTPDVTYWALSSAPVAVGEIDGEVVLGNWAADADVPAYFTQGSDVSAATSVFTAVTAGLYRATFCIFITPDNADYTAGASFRAQAYLDLDSGANGPGYNYISIVSKELQSSDNPLSVTLTGAVDLPLDVDTTVELKFQVFGVSSDVSVTGAYVSFTRHGALA